MDPDAGWLAAFVRRLQRGGAGADAAEATAVAAAVPAPGVWAVDTSCVVPMRLVPRAYEKAYAYRSATEGACTQLRMRAGIVCISAGEPVPAKREAPNATHMIHHLQVGEGTGCGQCTQAVRTAGPLLRPWLRLAAPVQTALPPAPLSLRLLLWLQPGPGPCTASCTAPAAPTPQPLRNRRPPVMARDPVVAVVAPLAAPPRHLLGPLQQASRLTGHRWICSRFRSAPMAPVTWGWLRRQYRALTTPCRV